MATPVGSTDQMRLSEISGVPSGSDDAQIARDESRANSRHERWLRSGLVGVLSALFGLTNLAILVVVGFCIYFDAYFVQADVIEPADRIITSRVVMTLIGATTVQVGAVMLSIAAYFFPRRKAT